MSPAVVTNVDNGFGGFFSRIPIGYSDKHANKIGQLVPTLAPSGVPIPASDEGSSSSFPPTPDSARIQNASHQMASSASTSQSHTASNGSASMRQFRPAFEPRSYTILKEVGDGSFGTVWLADWHSELQLPPGTLPPGPSSRPEYRGKQLVAVKRMKKAFEGGWEECMRLKELRSLRSIQEHPNIIPLYDAFLSPDKELYFVFECMEGNLYQLTKSRKGRALASGLISSIFYQTLCAIDHVHSSGFFHRDIKPENLLITTTGLADYPSSSLYALPGAPPEKDVTVIVKLADFGLARETASRPPYTEYVSTRWYRAPEVLLRSRDYSNPVDMWAIGTVLVEVVTLKPLFPGDSEIDQVYKICSVLGDPSSSYGSDETGRPRGGGPWREGSKLARDVGFSFPKMAPKSMSSFFDSSTVPNQLIDCIADLLRYEPSSRLTAADCLRHPYFYEIAPRFAPLKQTAGFSPAAAPNGHLAASRPLPPSHSNSSASSKPSFPNEPDGGHDPIRSVRSDSHVSGMSAYGFHIAPPSSTRSPSLSFPENVHPGSDGMPSPAMSNGTWPGQPHPTTSASWNTQDAPRIIPPFGTTMQRRPSFNGSIAASTFYDGSIFEGIAPNRAASIMSFPVGPMGHSALQGSPSSQHPATFAMARHPSGGSYAPSVAQQSVYDQNAHRRAAESVRSSAASIASPVPSTKSRWGLGAVFSSNSSTAAQGSASNDATSLKRSASTSQNKMQVDSAPAVPLDPKQAKKAAKEAERLKREAMQVASRERARAVMRKKNQLMEAADPLHNFTSKVEGSQLPVDKGKARAADRMSIKSSTGAHKMPQIVEDTGRLYVNDNRFRSRRRADDDDGQSISSNSTGHSSQHRGRPASVFSQATSASDPERFARYAGGDMSAYGRRAPSVHSVQSATPSFYSYGPAPNTGHSSLDSQLIAHMQGLATNGGDVPWASNERSESVPRNGLSYRATSPADERSQRFTPYNVPHAAHSALGVSTGSNRNGAMTAPPHASFPTNGNMSAPSLVSGSHSMPAGELPQMHYAGHFMSTPAYDSSSGGPSPVESGPDPSSYLMHYPHANNQTDTKMED